VTQTLVAILPTRNEAGSIDWVIERLAALGAAIIVVDDDSSDQTAVIAEASLRRLGASGSVVRRIGRRGRGSAVVEGMREAAECYPDFTHLIELDADGSHDPAEAEQLLKVARSSGAELVVGARVPARSVDGREWPLHRKLFHYVNGALIQALLRLPVSDPTNGYRIWSRTATERLTSIVFREEGFIWVAESTHALARMGAQILESPVHFYPRRAGQSKAGLREIVRSLYGLIRITTSPALGRRGHSSGKTND
jgi:dolichol-phosphate mannosyltransferase